MGWVVNATPRPPYPRERPGTHYIGGWVGPRAGLDGCGKFRPPQGFDPFTVQPLPSCANPNGNGNSGCRKPVLKTIVWDVTLCSMVAVHSRFGGTRRLHLQGRNVRRWEQSGSWFALPSGYMAWRPSHLYQKPASPNYSLPLSPIIAPFHVSECSTTELQEAGLIHRASSLI